MHVDQTELRSDFAGNGKAQEPAGVLPHSRYMLRLCVLGCDYHVYLIFPPLVIMNEDEPAARLFRARPRLTEQLNEGLHRRLTLLSAPAGYGKTTLVSQLFSELDRTRFLAAQIVTGVILVMHYTPHADMAFNSVEHIMRDVNYGWLMRYLHANGASLFFAVVYLHTFRNLYYGSYKYPRELLWWIGLFILLYTAIQAFIYLETTELLRIYEEREQRGITDVSPWISPRELQQVEAVVQHAGAERLKPIHDALHGRIGYEQIRIAVACLENQTAVNQM